MKKWNVLIVDDEPVAQRILELHLAAAANVQLVGICKDCKDAMAAMKEQSVDLLLMDINMPGMNGIEFVRTLNNTVAVIFTTAYNEFAMESYELNAVDYLLKPVSKERLLRAIDKFEKLQSGAAQPLADTPVKTTHPEFLFVKNDGKLHKVVLADLWLIESKGDYLKLYIGDKTLLTYSSMKNFEKRLEYNTVFIRVNKSAIVNRNYINEIEGNCLRIRDKEVIVGLTYKQHVAKQLESYMP